MTVVLVAVGALAAACVQATAGLGFALVLSPVTFALLSPAGAIVIVTALGLELSLLVLLAERRSKRVAWGEVIPIVAAAVPGIVCGVLLLRVLPRPFLQVGVGAAVLAAALVRIRGRGRPSGPGSPTMRLAFGFASGTLTTSSGVSGPPIALWLARRGLCPAELRDSLSATFLAIGTIAAVSLVPLLPRAHLRPAMLEIGFACVVGGHALGSRAFARLGARRFEPLLMAVILAAAAASITAGAKAL